MELGTCSGLRILKGLDTVVKLLFLQRNWNSVNPRVVLNYTGVLRESSSARCMSCGCTLLPSDLFCQW